MIINYWAVLICAVLSMVIGYVWYGPLFGRKWMKIVGVTPADIEARKQMQKGVGKLYFVQFLLSLFQVWVLAYYIGDFKDAIWIWAGFIIPVVAGTAMWNNDSSKIAWTRFLIQAGYQLILFIVFGLILTIWM